jgi:hypothetical protein
MLKIDQILKRMQNEDSSYLPVPNQINTKISQQDVSRIDT